MCTEMRCEMRFLREKTGKGVVYKNFASYERIVMGTSELLKAKIQNFVASRDAAFRLSKL